MGYAMSTCTIEGERFPYDPGTREAYVAGRWWDLEEEWEELLRAVQDAHYKRDRAEDLECDSFHERIKEVA